MQALHLHLLASLALAPTTFAQQPVFVETIKEVAVQRTERVLGNLRARSTSLMAALEEGALIELGVREGDKVKLGAVLAILDGRRLKAEIAQVDANRAVARATQVEREAQLQDAEADLISLTAAAESGAISEQDLRHAQTAVATGKALVEAAKQQDVALAASRDLLELRLDDMHVRAPFDAVVTMRHAEIGEWIRAGDPLVTLVSSGPLEAWIDLPERLAGLVNPAADSIEIQLEATGQMVLGKAPRFVPMVSEKARTFPLLLDVPAALPTGMQLHPGMSISALIPIGSRAANLVLPRDAVMRRGADALVAKVGEGDLAELVPVKQLFGVEGGFAVAPLIPGSLKVGDRVVVEGNERLFPGVPLIPSKKPVQGPKKGPEKVPAKKTDNEPQKKRSDEKAAPKKGPETESGQPGPADPYPKPTGAKDADKTKDARRESSI